MRNLKSVKEILKFTLILEFLLVIGKSKHERNIINWFDIKNI